MNLEIDSGKLLYALGVLFAIGALLYFVRDLVFGLSITVKAALLFVGFVAFFLAGVAIDRGLLDVVAFVLSGLSYAVFVGYVVTRYELGDTGAFLLFGVSAALFVGLGYLVRERDPSIPARTAGVAVAGLLVVTLVLVGADVAAGEVRYQVELEDSVTVDPPAGTDDREVVLRDVDVGSVTASNGVAFRRPLDPPSVRGCLAGVDTLPDPVREPVVPVDYEPRRYDRPGTIGGGEAVTFDLTARIPVSVNASDPTTLAVERGSSCDVERDSPTLVLVFEGDPRPRE